MMDEQSTQQTNPEVTPVAAPNDQGSIGITGFVRIFDPKTNETMVETRA